MSVYKVSWADQSAAASATQTAVSTISGIQGDVNTAKGKVATWEGESQAEWNIHQNNWNTYIGNIIDAMQDFSKGLTAAATLSEGAEKQATQIMSQI